MPMLTGSAKSHRREIFAAHTGDGQMNRSPMRCVRSDRYKYILNLKPEDRFKTHITDGIAGDGRDYWESWVRLAARDQHAKWMVDRYQHRPAEELYDVSMDPQEQTNLIADANHAAVLEEMRKKLREWRVQQGEDLARVLMPEDARRGELKYAG